MKASRKIHQSLKGPFLPWFLLACFMLYFSVLPANVFAGLLLDADLRFTYEDNVVGLLSDQPRGAGGGGGTPGGMTMPALGIGGTGGGPNKNRYTGSGSGATQTGDFSAAVSAEAGGYQDVGGNAALFAKAFANHTSYDTFTDLNATIGGVSTGIIASLSDSVLVRVAVLGDIKRFGDSERDSTAYGGNISLKEKLTPSFWVRELGGYEKNHADNAVFSYTGTTAGAGVGYALDQMTLVTFGYSYLIRKFEEPSGAEIKTNTVYAGAEHSFTKSWSVGAEYDRQRSRENITGSSTTDNIFSLALRYAY
jgi:hypothetical protein